MSIFKQIQNDLTEAMKFKDEVKRDTLRGLISEIKNEAVEQGTDRNEVSDEVVMNVLTKAAKSRKESIVIYETSGRKDLLDTEKKELEVIEHYLPAKMTDSELQQIIDKVRNENPSVQGMALMGKVMPLVKGQADPDDVKRLLG